jgi:excisionase family DNA binding protein
MEKRLYNVQEVSKILGCATNSVYSLIHGGSLGAVKILSNYRVPVEELERYLTTLSNNNEKPTTRSRRDQQVLNLV